MAALRTGDITALVNNRIDRKLVPTLEKSFRLARFAEQRPLEKGQGDTVQLMFWDNPTISTAQADELAAGNENSLGNTTVTVQVGFYADDYAFSELAEAIDKTGSILSGHVGRAVYQVSGTYDTIVRDALSAAVATSTRVANGKTVANLLASDTVNIPELNHIVTVMEGRDVEPHPKAMGYYGAIYHTRNCGDMRGDTGGGGPMALTWNDWSRRTSPGQLKSGELGDMLGIMPIKSTNIQRLTNGAGVVYYNAFVLGADALVMTSINGLAAAAGERGGRPLVRVIPKMFSHATPFANKIRVVFKFYTGATIIDSTRLIMHQIASAS